jgi:hypothetical protein
MQEEVDPVITGGAIPVTQNRVVEEAPEDHPNVIGRGLLNARVAQKQDSAVERETSCEGVGICARR